MRGEAWASGRKVRGEAWVSGGMLRPPTESHCGRTGRCAGGWGDELGFEAAELLERLARNHM